MIIFFSFNGAGPFGLLPLLLPLLALLLWHLMTPSMLFTTCTPWVQPPHIVYCYLVRLRGLR